MSFTYETLEEGIQYEFSNVVPLFLYKGEDYKKRPEIRVNAFDFVLNIKLPWLVEPIKVPLMLEIVNHRIGGQPKILYDEAGSFIQKVESADKNFAIHYSQEDRYNYSQVLSIITETIFFDRLNFVVGFFSKDLGRYEPVTTGEGLFFTYYEPNYLVKEKINLSGLYGYKE